MHRHTAFHGLVGLLVAAGLAHAQGAPFYANPTNANNPFARPRLSPWLNLTRGGNPASNYYLGVLPEVDRRNQEFRVNQQLNALEREVTNPTLGPEVQSLVPTLEETGHPTAFMSVTPYFGGAAGLGRTGTTLPTATGRGVGGQSTYQPPPSKGRGR